MKRKAKARKARTPVLYLGALCLAGLGAVRGASAAPDGLVCDGRVVSQGDYAERVLRVCGEPAARTQRVEYRTVQRRVRGPCGVPRPSTSRLSSGPAHPPATPLRNRAGCSYLEEHTVEIIVERWTYDFGRNRLVHYLLFEDDQLIKVQVGGYGDRRPAS